MSYAYQMKVVKALLAMMALATLSLQLLNDVRFLLPAAAAVALGVLAARRCTPIMQKRLFVTSFAAGLLMGFGYVGAIQMNWLFQAATCFHLNALAIFIAPGGRVARGEEVLQPSG